MSYKQTPYTIALHNNQKDSMNVGALGMAMLTGGLCQIVAINGIGLVTDGFLWQGNAIWMDLNALSPISTSWASSNASVTTSWSSSNASITTAWAAADNFGDEFPS
jgi:hypothetical protein